MFPTEGNGKFAEILVERDDNARLFQGKCKYFFVPRIGCPGSGPDDIVSGRYERYQGAFPNAGIKQ